MPTRDQTRRHVRANGQPRPIEATSKLLWTYEDLASAVDLSVGTLRQRVRSGTGPAVTLIGRHHRFAPKDVATWVDEMRANSGVED